MASLHSLGQDDRNEVQHDLSCHVMPLALILASHVSISIVKETATFLTSKKSKWQATWLLWSCDTITIANGIIWCHCYWCHMIPLASVLVLHDACRIINGTIIFLGHDDRSEVQHDFLGHMMPLALASASCDANTIYVWHHCIPYIKMIKMKCKHNFFGHVTPLAPASAPQNSDVIVNSTITFLTSR